MGYMGSDNIAPIIIYALIYSTTTMATNLHTNMQLNLTTDDLAAQPFVDILIMDYFKTEKLLWEQIEKRADNVLIRVFKAHETFFDQVMEQSGSGVISRGLIPNIETLIQIGSNVNSTTEMGQTHLKEQTLDRRSITEYSTFALKILKDASNLFDYATNDTLWDNIISVSHKLNTLAIRFTWNLFEWDSFFSFRLFDCLIVCLVQTSDIMKRRRDKI